MGLFNNKVSCEDITMLETSHPTRIMNLWGTNGIQKPLMNNSTKDLLLFVLYWYYVGLVCISANNNSNLYAYHTRCLLYIYTFDLQGLQGKYFSVCVCHATSWTTWVHMLQHAAVNYVFICEILCWLRTIKLRFRSWRPRGSKQASFFRTNKQLLQFKAWFLLLNFTGTNHKRFGLIWPLSISSNFRDKLLFRRCFFPYDLQLQFIFPLSVL